MVTTSVGFLFLLLLGATNSFEIMCPKGYQAFHTFHGPINVENYKPTQYIDCVKYENENCQERCYWGGASNGKTRGNCGYHNDVYEKDIYHEEGKSVYAAGFEFDGSTVDRTYCCVSSGTKVKKASCQNKLLYNTYNQSSMLNIASKYPQLTNPITRSMDVKTHDGGVFDYVIQACDTEYVSDHMKTQCKP